VERRLAAILAADVAGYGRLMGVDEEGTLAELKGHRQALVDPKIEEHRGRIVKTTGDGMLVEFASVVDAVRCAVEMQRGMNERNARLSVDKRIQFRVGINLGDIIIDDDDIYGDGVNIAARLEGIAEPGGICISRQAHDHLLEKLSFTCEKLGLRNLKNIAKPVEVYSVNFGSVSMTQEIKYCRAPDGVRLAYATVGQGSSLVKAANWMNHLEYDWESPIWHHFLEGLAKNHTLVRYDARGNGLSDWDVDELSLDAWVSDLETVVDTLGIERFPLLGVSQGCAISIAYAARHPQRLSHLILYGGFALGGGKRSPGEQEKRKAMGTLMRLGWAQMIRHSGKCLPHISFPRAQKNRLIGSTTFNGRPHHLNARLVTLKSWEISMCANCSHKCRFRRSSCMYATISWSRSMRAVKWRLGSHVLAS
jgi:class 3 adenylate cyclase